jgi:ribosomal protein S12 methylthiotransferase accessory factor
VTAAQDLISPVEGVRILGSAGLRQAVESALVRHPAGGGLDRGVDVFVNDEADGGDDGNGGVAAAARAAHASCRDFLPVYPTPRGVRIGPYTRAGEAGCHLCVEARQRHARIGGEPDRAALWQGIYSGAVRVPRPVLGPAVRAMVSGLVADELSLAGRADRGRCRGAFLEIATASLAIARHAFIPEPDCPLCGDLPDDGPEAGRLALVPRPKTTPDSYRLRSLTSEHEQLRQSVVDPETGPLTSLTVHHEHPMIVVRAAGGPVDGEIRGYGRTFTYPEGVSVAIAEALERLAGRRPRARRTAVRAPYRDLGPQRAIEPTALGLPANPPSHHAVAYHPDAPLEWVYGYSFRRDGPVLVPECMAYFARSATSFGGECSNGCALGSTLEEAILHGIFEAAERDAFLCTWYAQLPVRRIDPMSSADPTTRMLVHWLQRTTGSRLDVFDTTMPEGLPSMWLMLVDHQGRPGHPRAFCGAGAHLDPERALRSGLVELASGASAARDVVAGDSTAPELVADPDLVRTMEQHMLAAACPQSWPRFAFLYENPQVASMTEAFPASSRYRPAADLLDDLRHVVSRYLDGGLDVVVVDQTGAEQAAVDLASVKVLIPGLLPMTFGHRNRRVDLPRLREVAVRLGHRSHPLTPQEINPYPHPFP